MNPRLLHSVFVSIALIIFSSSFAAVDPDPDGIGVYFDTEATINNYDGIYSTVWPNGGNDWVYGNNVPMYVILTNLTDPVYEVDVTITVISKNPDYQATFPDTYFDPPGGRVFGFIPTAELYVEYDESGAMVGTTHQLVFTDGLLQPESDGIVFGASVGCFGTEEGAQIESPVIEVYIHSNGYFNGVEWKPLHPSSGNWDEPVAIINSNGIQPVVSQEESWGALKSMYR